MALRALRSLRAPGRRSAGAALGAVALAAAAAAALFHGCAAPNRERWARDALAEAAPAEAEWERYHWYYPAIGYNLAAHWSNDGGYSGPLVHMTLRVAAKALTQEGASRVGALDLEGWNHAVKSLEVVHLDSAGRRVDVPMGKVSRDFREKGLIIVPRVEKGSTVSVRVVRGPFSSIDWWELHMDRSVPVLASEVRLTAGRGIEFETRAYNGLEGPALESNGRFRAPTRIWTARRVMPMAQLPYPDAMGARPRFLITNRNNAYGTRVSTWEAVAWQKRKGDYDMGLLNLSGEVRAQAKALIAGAADDTARAMAILAFVQNRISRTPGASGGLGLDAVLERRKGSGPQVASLLAAMFEAAGLPAHIVLTRDSHWGGLDPEAANPNAAQNPVVIVSAGGREYAAYPLSSAYAFGDYPSGLMGQKALVLGDGTLRDLPPPRHGTSRIALRQEIDPDAAGSRGATAELQGPAAAMAREQWVESLAGDPLEGCRAILRRVGFQAGIRKCSQHGLEEREKPFRLELALESSGTWIHDDTATLWTAPDLFARPAWFYDSARTEAYHLPYDLELQETVAFKSAAGKPPKAHIPCRDLDNAFMAVACRWEAPGRFTRETRIRKGRHAAADLKARHADLLGLDRIREARLAIRKR